MAHALMLLLLGLYGSPQPVAEQSRGGVDPWGTRTATLDVRGGLDAGGGSAELVLSETDCRGGVDPWGRCSAEL